MRLPSGNRGVSEVYGTLLIISLAFISAVALVGIGFFVVDDTTGDADDRLARDSLVELGDRLSGLTGSSVEDATVWEPPEGTAGEFEARSDAGEVTVTVTTNGRWWNETDNTGGPGSLVDAENRTNSTTVTLGTISHESSDGVVTGYQGGGLFEVDGDAVSVLRDPGIEVTDGSLSLSFIDISSVEHIGGGELVAREEVEKAATGEIQKVIDRAMKRDGEVVAPAEINVTIESEFAKGWAQYAESGIESDRNITVWRSDELAGLDEDEVKIGFGEFGEGLELPDENETFADDVVYTGLAEWAPDLYDPDEGTINETGDGFNVTGPSENMTAILYDDGDGYEWYVWDPEDTWRPNGNYSDKWVSVEEPDPSERVLDDVEEPSASDGFDLPDGTWTAVVNTTGKDRSLEAFREFLPSADNGSVDEGVLKSPIEVDNPGEYAGKYGPFLMIDTKGETGEFETVVYENDTGVMTGDNETGLVGEHNVSVAVEGINVGSADAEDEPVALLFDPDSKGMESARFVNTTEVSPGINESFAFSSWWEPLEPGTYNFSAGTGHDDVNRSNRTKIRFDEPDLDGNFSIESLTVDNETGGETVVEGTDERIEAEIEVRNRANVSATQPVYLRYDGGAPRSTLLNATTVALDENGTAGSSEVVSLSWEPIEGDAGSHQINVTTLDDFETAAVGIRDISAVEPEFEIEDLDHPEEIAAGETLTARFDVNNTGELSDTQSVILRNETSGAVFDGTNVELSGGERSEIELNWTVTTDDVGDRTVRVTTNDDEETFDVTVTPPERDSEFNVSIADLEPGSEVTEGDRLTVVAEVVNTGDDGGTKPVWVENTTGEQVAVGDLDLDPAESETIELDWDTRPADIGSGNLTLRSPDDEESRPVEVIEREDAEPEFEATITGTNSPVVEGEPLEVTVEIENNGTAAGGTNVLLRNMTGTSVNVTDTGAVGPGNSTTVSLTWYTLIGDADGDRPATGNVTVEAEGTSDAENVTIQPKPTTRPPVDVAFVTDETGSMGEWRSDTDWMEIVDSREVSGDPWEVPEGDEVWITKEDLYCGWEWTGEEYEYLCEERGDDYFVSGQEVDPGDYGGSVEIFKLGVDEDCSHCNDPWGDRYFAVQNAVGSLNASKDYAGLVEFDTFMSGNARAYQDLTNDLDEVNESLRIDPGGGTDISRGAFEGQDLLSEQGSPDRENFIILLTDGQHTEGYPEPDDPYTYNYVGENTTLYTVGFGDAREEELTTLAENAGTQEGEYIEAENSEELAGIFEGLVEEITEEEPPEYVIRDVSVPESTVEQGETVEFEVTVENVAGTTSPQPVLLFDTGFNGFPVEGQAANITAGGTETITFEWDTTGVVDWETTGSNETTGEVTIDTPSDEETVDVTITEPPEADLQAEILGTNTDPDDPVIAGEETLSVEVEITNEGEARENQTLLLERGDGSPTPTTRTVGPAPGDSETVTLTWDLPVRDASLDAVRASTDDDTDEAEVYVEPPADDASNFTVEIEDYDRSVTVGESVDVRANVTNTGDVADDAIVVLRNVDGDPTDAESTPELGSGDSTEIGLSWPTAEAASGNVTVTAGDANASAAVTVSEPAEGDFRIENVETNADGDGEFIYYQDSDLNVTVNITNEGGSDARVITVADGDGGGLVASDGPVFIEEGNTNKTSLDWSPQSDEVEIINVSTGDHYERQFVDIRSSAGVGNITVEVETNASSRSESVDAGEVVEVTADITANEDINEQNVFVAAEATLGGRTAQVGLKERDLNLNASETRVIEFDWETRRWFGDNSEAWTVSVETLSVEGVGDAWLDDIAADSPNDPDVGENNPVGVDIDEIEVS